MSTAVPKGSSIASRDEQVSTGHGMASDIPVYGPQGEPRWYRQRKLAGLPVSVFGSLWHAARPSENLVAGGDDHNVYIKTNEKLSVTRNDKTSLTSTEAHEKRSAKAGEKCSVKTDDKIYIKPNAVGGYKSKSASNSSIFQCSGISSGHERRVTRGNTNLAVDQWLAAQACYKMAHGAPRD